MKDSAIREFNDESPVPGRCFGTYKPEGTFPIDQPMIRELALAFLEAKISVAAYTRFECKDSAARMAAAAWNFQHLAGLVACEYILAAHETMKGLPNHAQVQMPLVQPDAEP